MNAVDYAVMCDAAKSKPFVAAIRFIREATGYPLHEAKRAYDRDVRPLMTATPSHSSENSR